MTAELPGTDRCPKCGAAVRYGDPWCTLCYADLRPPPPPEPEMPTPRAVPREAVARVVGASSEPLLPIAPAPAGAPVEGPSWPCTTCGAINPMARDVCVSCGMPFLSAL